MKLNSISSRSGNATPAETVAIMSNNMTVREAAEYLDVEDLGALKRLARKLGCLAKDGLVAFIDMDAFKAAFIKRSFERREQVHNPKPKSLGSELGIRSARLARAPELIRRKKEAIEKAKQSRTAAQTNYEKQRASAMLAELEEGLKRLEAVQAEDEKRRQEILNGPVPSNNNTIGALPSGRAPDDQQGVNYDRSNR